MLQLLILLKQKFEKLQKNLQREEQKYNNRRLQINNYMKSKNTAIENFK